MKYTVEIGKIVEGALKFDREKVRSYTELLITKLEEDNEERAASKFKRLLSNSPDSGYIMKTSSVGYYALPTDSESGSKLADATPPADDTEIILSNENRSILNHFLDGYRNADRLSAKGLDLPSTMLLAGPPGCGKSKCAEYISQELELPLITARLDSLISSYLGTTAKNIRKLFEYAEKTPCILFLDEFDAIAKARDDGNDLGELKRVVNSLLQNVDNFPSESLLLAASNHPQMLDPAVWRRFSFKLEMNLPDRIERTAMIDLFSRGIADYTKKETDLLSNLFEGFSGSDIETVLKQSARNAILSGREPSFNETVLETLTYTMTQDSSLTDRERNIAKAKYLSSRSISVPKIAEILSIPQTTIYRMMKK